MMVYKSCPKCRGDLVIEADLYGGPPDFVCIQCGYTARPNERLALITKVKQRLNAEQRPAFAPAEVERRAS